MESDLQFALELTVTGMGLVFLLLALLWGLISLLLRLDRSPAPAPRTAPAAAERDTSLPADLMAAITVAVLTHRAERRKEAGAEVRSVAPGVAPSRWLVIGRTRQTRRWQPRRPV